MTSVQSIWKANHSTRLCRWLITLKTKVFVRAMWHVASLVSGRNFQAQPDNNYWWLWHMINQLLLETMYEICISWNMNYLLIWKKSYVEHGQLHLCLSINWALRKSILFLPSFPRRFCTIFTYFVGNYENINKKLYLNIEKNIQITIQSFLSSFIILMLYVHVSVASNLVQIILKLPRSYCPHAHLIWH